MKTKIWSLMFFATPLFLGIKTVQSSCEPYNTGCFAQEAAQKAAASHDPNSCLKSKVPNDCLLALAVIMKDGTICQRLPGSDHDSLLATCYKNLAASTLDPDWCSKVPSWGGETNGLNRNSEDCFARTYDALARRDNNTSLCDKISHYHPVAGGMVSSCYSSIAFNTHHYELCNKLNPIDQNDCLYYIGIMTNDCSILKQTSNESWQFKKSVHDCERALEAKKSSSQDAENAQSEPPILATDPDATDKSIKRLAEVNSMRIVGPNGIPIERAYVLYTYNVPGAATGGSIVLTDKDGRYRLEKSRYPSDKAVPLIIVAPKLHNASTGIPWSSPSHVVNKKAGTITLKDFTDDPEGWFNSLGEFLGKVMINVTQVYPPEASLQASPEMKRAFVNLYLSEAEAFKVKYSQLATNQEWKNRFQALDSQIKMIKEQSAKL